MKKMMAWVLALVLLICAASAFAEGEALTAADLDNMVWCFSSGAGGWSTDINTGVDGAFTGSYHDSEMGESADEYPNGTMYVCSFSGALSVAEQTGENAWRIHIDSLTLDGEIGAESIEEGIRYVNVEPYGIHEGDDFTLYLPGTPVDALTEDMRMWAHLLGDDAPAELEDWFMYSEANESGFVGYPDVAIANPWTDTTAEGLAEVSGVTFGVPEDAKDVVYRWLESEGLAEMQFTMFDVDEFCARAQAATLEEGQLMNISGMYFDFDNEEEVTIGGCPGTLGIAQTGTEDWVELCMWYDAKAGMAYSLSVSTTDPDGLDLTAVAQMVYPG